MRQGSLAGLLGGTLPGTGQLSGALLLGCGWESRWAGPGPVGGPRAGGLLRNRRGQVCRLMVPTASKAANGPAVPDGLLVSETSELPHFLSRQWCNGPCS